MDYLQAVQAIAACENRAEDFERRLAEGRTTPDVAEIVIRDSLGAATSLRHAFDIQRDAAAELARLTEMFSVSVETGR